MPQRASSSSFPDEAGADTSTTLPARDNRAHQELIRRVAQNLGMQAEEVAEETDPLVDILVPKGPLRVALPLINSQ